jgi:hypothetical protein
MDPAQVLATAHNQQQAQQVKVEQVEFTKPEPPSSSSQKKGKQKQKDNSHSSLLHVCSIINIFFTYGKLGKTKKEKLMINFLGFHKSIVTCYSYLSKKYVEF